MCKLHTLKLISYFTLQSTADLFISVICYVLHFLESKFLLWNVIYHDYTMLSTKTALLASAQGTVTTQIKTMTPTNNNALSTSWSHQWLNNGALYSLTIFYICNDKLRRWTSSIFLLLADRGNETVERGNIPFGSPFQPLQLEKAMRYCGLQSFWYVEHVFCYRGTQW